MNTYGDHGQTGRGGVPPPPSQRKIIRRNLFAFDTSRIVSNIWTRILITLTNEQETRVLPETPVWELVSKCKNTHMQLKTRSYVSKSRTTSFPAR